MVSEAWPDHLHRITQISQLHVAEDKQPPLLQLVDKQNELAGRARVGHHQQHLRPPELDVVFSHIQHEQVLPHLRPEDTKTDKNCTPDICDGVPAAYLMKNQRLADVAPAAGWRSVVEDEQKQQQEDDAARGVDRIDHEHHH